MFYDQVTQGSYYGVVGIVKFSYRNSPIRVANIDLLKIQNKNFSSLISTLLRILKKINVRVLVI